MFTRLLKLLSSYVYLKVVDSMYFSVLGFIMGLLK